MGWWQVSADTLARSRFVVSPIAEATASLMTLVKGAAAHPAERAWLDDHRPAFRERLADDPVTALLIRVALSGPWLSDFLLPTPTGEGEPDFAAELARVRETPPEVARADVSVSLGGPLPAALQRADLPLRAAGLLEWVWEETVVPYWPRRRRIIEADIVARTTRLSQGGWAAALDELRPGMRWLGEGRLQINAYDYPPREISGARLMFVPVTSRHGWVSWDEPHRYAAVYPCTGALADVGPAVAVPGALSRLLGPARAGVLVLLGTPVSTTQLVALTGQGLGSVGRHLKVLLDAGLVRRRRAGRSVLYHRTDAGDILVTAQTHGGGPPRDRRPAR
ncbi:helix-turn-helix domain-containing protein [Sphaerisporangium sp. TRM90804]|uniref:ArsR/SmtB family transcription factor n=1 Tax=Sphaerisporangium sp. TRM90804 TaxID=3031113 RepID=UPI0024491BD5|nr:helix-turn-helix domain-containing protein [Sphaerisporangium sp. TRM90804]MDH2424932.1 helix-turn-helix domain-containing protein [Sphaerisporangium sp. TRM90804]